MAQRLATVYVKTSLQLSEAEMLQLVRLFAEHQVRLQIQVTENGTQEIVFHDDSGKEIVLTFERKGGKFVCVGSCRMSSPRLANLMRKAVSVFRGDAVVHRVYDGFTMEYRYVKGVVVRIAELRGGAEKIIYEYRDTVGQLEELYRQTQIEDEIRMIQSRIDRLLDERNNRNGGTIETIDLELGALVKRLFALEA